MTRPSNLPAVQVDTSRVSVPFATFISQKSKRFADALAVIPGLQEPNVVLFAPEPVLVAPCKFHLLTAQQVWAEITDEGDLVDASFERPNREDFARLKEVIEAVVLLYAPAGIVPARMAFRTTKCPAALTAAAALAKAASPEWKDKGEAYALTLAIPEPFARFTATVTTSQRTAKSTGRKMWMANSLIAPTTAEELNKLLAYLQQPEAAAAISAAVDSFNARVEELHRAAA